LRTLTAPLISTRFCHRVIRIIACWFALASVFVSSTAQAQQATIQTAEQSVTAAKQNGNPIIELHTNLGLIQLELFPEKSPRSVENFLAYVKKGYYDATVFHRVIEGFMIQGGGLDLRLETKPTDNPVQNEADNGLSNQKFTVSMARTGDPHSATAQFFINTANNQFLDHKSKTDTGWGYAVIGRVIGGMRVAEWMSKAPTGPSDVPLTPIVIEKALILQ